MRIAFILAPLVSVLGFSWTAKAAPQAIDDLLNQSENVATCVLNEDRTTSVDFYVHKINETVVAQFKGPSEHFYALDMIESKSKVTLIGNREIMTLNYDLYFKTLENPFTIVLDQNTVRDPTMESFTTSMRYANGQRVMMTCQRLKH